MYNIHVNVWVDLFMVYGFVLVRGARSREFITWRWIAVDVPIENFEQIFTITWLKRYITNHITELNEAEHPFRDK